MLLRPGDSVEVREGSRKRTFFKELHDAGPDRPAPEWVKRDFSRMGGEILRFPERTDIDLSINEQLVVEYYSR